MNVIVEWLMSFGIGLVVIVGILLVVALIAEFPLAFCSILIIAILTLLGRVIVESVHDETYYR